MFSRRFCSVMFSTWFCSMMFSRKFCSVTFSRRFCSVCILSESSVCVSGVPAEPPSVAEDGLQGVSSLLLLLLLLLPAQHLPIQPL